jgi:hypothetical protein
MSGMAGAVTDNEGSRHERRATGADQVQAAAGELLVRAVGGRGGGRPGKALGEGGDVLTGYCTAG